MTDTMDEHRKESPEPAQSAAERAASYEHARDELADGVARLESGGLSLDESLVLWERGEHLAAVCTRFLDGAAGAGREPRSARAGPQERADAGRHQAEPQGHVTGVGTELNDPVLGVDEHHLRLPVRASASVSIP